MKRRQNVWEGQLGLSLDIPGVFLDSVNSEVKVGSIIQVSNDTGLNGMQGIVVGFRTSAGDCTIGAFFYPEVWSTDFVFLDVERAIVEWDKNHAEKCLKNPGYVLRDSIWNKSPRVRFFSPKEVTVVPYWKPLVLAKRTFGIKYNILDPLPPELWQRPELYRCWCEGCQKPARGYAVVNVVGSIQFLATCNQHHNTWHGLRIEAQVEMHQQIMYTDGRPVLPSASAPA